MLKQILNLDGAQEMSKIELKSVTGGDLRCSTDSQCPDGHGCESGPIGSVKAVGDCVNGHCMLRLVSC